MIKYLSGDTDADFSFYRYWNRNCQYRKEKIRWDAEAEEKRNFIPRFQIKSERIHTLTQLLKAYSLFEKM
jgi:preprotein translocase subunit SecA